MATRSRPPKVQCECCLAKVAKVDADGYCAGCVKELQLIEIMEMDEE